MERPISITISGGNTECPHSNFKIRLSDSSNLDQEIKFYIGLHSISIAYTWDNISSEYGTNTFRYSVDNGTAWKTITLSTNGNYTYADIATFIEIFVSSNGDDIESIKLHYVFNVKICYIELKTNVQVVL